MQTTQDFLDASAFERAALATVYPLVDPHAARGDLDLRSNVTRVQLHSIDDIGAHAREALIHELRPLLFGAAWKILDLMIEYGLSQLYLKQAYWTIEEKQAGAASGIVPPLSTDPDVWARLTALYAGTVEPRHCLIHRKFVFTATGDMTQLFDRAGRPVPDLSASEQVAFCRIGQRVSVILDSGSMTPRDRLDLVASLDLLTAHHKLSAIGGGASARRPLLVQVDAEQGTSEWTVDTAKAKTAALKVFPDQPYVDIEIHFPGSGFPPLSPVASKTPRSKPLSQSTRQIRHLG